MEKYKTLIVGTVRTKGLRKLELFKLKHTKMITKFLNAGSIVPSVYSLVSRPFFYLQFFPFLLHISSTPCCIFVYMKVMPVFASTMGFTQNTITFPGKHRKIYRDPKHSRYTECPKISS